MALNKSFGCVFVLFFMSCAFAVDPPSNYLLSINSTLENLLAQFSTLQQQHSVLQQHYSTLQQHYSALQQEVTTLQTNQNSSSVAFSAALTTSSNQLGSQETIRFDRIYTNIGNGYNKNGYFTAPVEGVYYFFVNVDSNNSHSLHVQLVKNGAEIARIYSAHGNDIGSGSAVVHLQVGDIVWARRIGGGSESIEGGLYSSFSGFLVS